MFGLAAMVYGLAAYAFFFVTFLYAIGFTGGLVVPKTIDSGQPGAMVPSLLIDAGLLAIFAVQHSVMARPAFKRWWTRILPKPVERSTYVLAATSALALLFWQWRPLPQPVWSLNDPLAIGLVQGLFFAGWGIVLLSTFLISHFELFGLQQVWQRLRNRPAQALQFRTPLLYGLVRHPIYLGFLIAFWAAPTMSLGHLIFAVATSGYILIGIMLEERDLEATFGEAYRSYRTRVNMLLPLPRRRAQTVSAPKGRAAV
ncbi:MAG TPA: isoprenylcysteine carboxylmethyltransferase family protein [Phenylobacterium sp.]